VSSLRIETIHMAKKSKKSNVSSASTPARFNGPMDPALLERFIKLMSENDVTSLEVSEGSSTVSLKRGYQGAAPVAYTPAAVAPMPAAAPAAPKATASVEDDTASLKAIKSPMVGTFYSSPSPDSKPFVQVGSVVNEDTDVCVIEAMKVFNNIKAELRGTIAKVCVENGKTVEFGTTLFLIKP
jgi:acetyl-CoA carboxylase biotin carboxyl carrier protein